MVSIHPPNAWPGRLSQPPAAPPCAMAKTQRRFRRLSEGRGRGPRNAAFGPFGFIVYSRCTDSEGFVGGGCTESTRDPIGQGLHPRVQGLRVATLANTTRCQTCRSPSRVSTAKWPKSAYLSGPQTVVPSIRHRGRHIMPLFATAELLWSAECTQVTRSHLDVTRIHLRLGPLYMCT